jgi:hypothetical protein
MKRTILVLVLVFALIYINFFVEGFEVVDPNDNLIIVVYNDEFYYLNIKNNETKRYDVYRIPLYLIKNFYK